jgi:hypothetical protein
MATTKQFTIGEDQEANCWYVYEYGNVHAVFTNQAQAEYWCTINELDYSVN